MSARRSCNRTVKEFVIRLVDRVTIKRQSNRLLRASYLRRRPRRRPALWLTGTYAVTALVPAWSVTTTAVVLLSAAVSLAPMEALNTNPTLLQGL